MLRLSVGIETVDNDVMKIINKTWQSDKIIANFINNAKEVGIKVKICLIFGLPGEPKNIVEKTIKFIETHKPDYVSLSGFCPMPGSPIFNDPDKYGIEFIDKDWDKHVICFSDFLTKRKLLLFRYKKESHMGNQFSRDQIANNINKCRDGCQLNQ